MKKQTVNHLNTIVAIYDSTTVYGALQFASKSLASSIGWKSCLTPKQIYKYKTETGVANQLVVLQIFRNCELARKEVIR
jgi:hypothetical protein